MIDVEKQELDESKIQDCPICLGWGKWHEIDGSICRLGPNCNKPFSACQFCQGNGMVMVKRIENV